MFQAAAAARSWPSGSRWRAALIYAALGAFAGLGQAPFDLPGATLLALVLVFLSDPGALHWRRAAWCGWAFGFGYFALVLHWIVEPFLVDVQSHGWMAPFALLFLAAGLALFWMLAFGIATRLASGVALALAWIGVEYLRAHIFTGFPWGMMVYGWVDSWAYQMAAYGGPYAVGLGILLLCLGIAAMFRRVPWAGVAATLCLAAASQFGPPAPAEDAGQAPLIRIVQPNAPQHEKWDPQKAPVFYDRMMAATLAAPRPELIVWPETAVPVTLAQSGAVLAQISGAAQGVPVVLGIRRFEGWNPYNSLIVVGAGGAVTDQYDKSHLVPFGEYIPFESLLKSLEVAGLATQGPLGYRPGEGPSLVNLGPLGMAQPLICYEGIFPHEVGRTSERPRLLLLITNDAWFGQFSGPYQHLKQAQARAIETGLPVVRSANTGISAMIDGRGRITAQLALGVAGHIDVPLPPALPETLYMRLRDWPVLVLWLIGLGWTVYRRRRISD